MVLFRKVQWAFGFSGVGAPGRWGLSALLERLGVGWPHPSLFSSSWLYVLSPQHSYPKCLTFWTENYLVETQQNGLAHFYQSGSLQRMDGIV